MTAWLHWICLWLADYYLSATILLAAVLALGTALREPVKRMSLAWGTLVGLPVLALLCAAPFWPRLSIVTAANETVSASAPREPTPAMPIPTVALPPFQVRPPTTNIGTLPQPIEHDEFHATQVAHVVHAAEPVDFSLLAAAIFLIGSAAMMLWLTVGAIYSRRLCRAAEPAPKFIEQELQAIAKHVRRLPKLLVSRLIHTAAAYGLLRPVILLPEDVLTSEHFLAVQRGASPAATRALSSASRSLTVAARPATLRTLLAHELAHIQRCDLWLLALGRLLLVVLFAHPLFWLLRRRIRTDQELIADAIAAECCGRHQYAENLVHWARRQPTALPRLAGALGIWERPSQLSRRITILLDDRIRLQTFCTRRWRMSATMGIAVSIAVLSLITLRPVPTVAETPPPQVTKYLAEMIDAAKMAYDWSIIRYQDQTRPRSLEEVYIWSRNWLDTQLQQSVTKEDRIKAYRAHQNRMARENEIVTILYKNGRRGGEADFEAATRYFLASANLWLLSQTDKPPANRNNVSPTAATEMKQMRAAARDAYQAVTASYEAGTGKLDDVYLWSKRWMQAEIDSGPAGDAKKFYGEHQQRMQQLNAVVSAKHRVGAVGGEGELFTAVTFYLAEADFLLAHLNGDAAKEAKAVVAAAGDAFDAWAAEYAAGKTDVQQACLWSRRWLHASLAASLPHQTADLDHRNRIEKLYDDVAAKRKAAEPGGMPDAVAVVQFYLAEANLLLAEHADDKTPTDPAPPAKAEKSEKGTSEKIQQPAKSSQDSSFLRGIDIVVQRAGGSNNTTNGLPEELGPQIAKLRGVDHVVGGLLDMVSFPDQDDVSALLYGLPPGCSLFERLKIQSGRQLVAGDKNKIMLGRELARRLDKKVGDQVELYGAWSFEVIGIYESPIKFENSGAVLPLAKLQQMMNRPGEVTGFNVVAKRPIDEAGLKDLAQRIELYAASLHRDDGSPLQLKAAPVGRGSPKALK